MEGLAVDSSKGVSIHHASGSGLGHRGDVDEYAGHHSRTDNPGCKPRISVSVIPSATWRKSRIGPLM